MADPFIEAHQVLPGFYTLATPLTPISIRDQMVRGTELAKRVLPLYQPKQPLLQALVVGAGAGGVCAAIILALRGFDVTLIDKASAAFAVQRSAGTRYIDPWQYDWPVFSTPPSRNFGTHFPLSYYPSSGASLAAVWDGQLQAWLAHFKRGGSPPGSLTWVPSTTFVGLSSASPGKMKVTLKHALPGPSIFDLVIYAVGFGEEKRALPNGSPTGPLFLTPKFWETDTFEDDYYGLHASSTPPATVKLNVAVVGSGDGALQDLLRVATKIGAHPPGSIATAIEVFEKLFAKAPLLGGPTRADVLSEVMLIDARYQRAWAWSGRGSAAEKEAFQKRHEALEDLAKRCIANSVTRKAAARLKRPGLNKIELVCPGDAFVALYTLNCFCVLLLARAFKADSSLPRIVFRFQHKAEYVDVNPAPRGKPLSGFSDAGPYKLHILPEGAPPTAPTTLLSADLVIVRTGISPTLSPASPAWRNLVRTKHLLPLE